MSGPRISVIMPALNGERYLGAAVTSILAQSEPQFEFIIIDDGSNDATPDLARDFAARDERIRFFCDGVRRGVASRLNQGLALASSDIIARMDADDVSLPERLARQLSYLENHPDTLLVGSRVTIIDPEGEELCEMGDAFSHEAIDSGLMNAAGQLIYHSSVMYRKNAALAVGGYDASYHGVEDLDFFLKLAERGRIANLPEPLLCYRDHFGSVGYRLREQQAREIRLALAAARQRRGLSPDMSALKGADALAPESTAEMHRKWGWWALKGGRVPAARKHAWRAFAMAPGLASARLVYCALRGR